MFNDSENGQTQYCEECLKKQEKIDKLELELDRFANQKVCYEENLKLCKQQEQQINKLATVLEEIYTIAEDTRAELSNRNAHARGNLRWIMDKIKAVR